MSIEKSHLVSWVESILRERVCSSLRISVDYKNQWIIALEGHEANFIMKRNSVFYEVGAEVSFCWLSNSKFNRLTGFDKLPMPGKTKPPECLHFSNGNDVEIPYDIIGLMFWCLCRIEEIQCENVDIHDRYSAKYSHAFKYSYLTMPVVDIWLKVFSELLAMYFPSIDVQQSQFKTELSHDVDSPSRYRFTPFIKKSKLAIGDVRRQKKIAACLPYLNNPYSKKHLSETDPYNSFQYIMDYSEKHDLVSTFYFMCGVTNKRFDGGYDIRNPAIVKVISDIAERGHIIGLHPSYECFESVENITAELTELRYVLKLASAKQVSYGARMHYLRYKYPNTPRYLSAAGLDHDATMGYADAIGFRAGTCHSYSAYDPIDNVELGVVIKPLLAMELTVVAEKYMGYGWSDKAYNVFCEIKDICKLYNGTFSLLWHNNYFHSDEQKALYESIIKR